MYQWAILSQGRPLLTLSALYSGLSPAVKYNAVFFQIFFEATYSALIDIQKRHSALCKSDIYFATYFSDLVDIIAKRCRTFW